MAPVKVFPPVTREEVEHILNYEFTNRDLLWEALQAAGNGVRVIGERKVQDGNKRLAMLGDAVLQLVVLYEWYEGGDKRQVGSEILQRLCCNRNLNSLGRVLRLEYFINANPSDKGIVYPTTMTASVEGLIGAVFLDGGMEAAANLARHWGLCKGTGGLSAVGISFCSVSKASAAPAKTAIADVNEEIISEADDSALSFGQNRTNDSITSEDTSATRGLRSIRREDDTESSSDSESLTSGTSEAGEDESLEESGSSLPTETNLDADDDEEDGGVKLGNEELRALSIAPERKDGRGFDKGCKEARKQSFMMWL